MRDSWEWGEDKEEEEGRSQYDRILLISDAVQE